jgi:predicted porin
MARLYRSSPVFINKRGYTFMKKYLLAIAAPACLWGTVAHAQSSVQLYGLIDEGFNYTTNAKGSRGYQLLAGDLAGSRWGLRGEEALGGGLSAVFRLESGFSPNTGKMSQGGREFGRQAYVGLSSQQYGTFTMGRQTDPTIDLWSVFTGAGNTIGDLAAHPFDNDNSDFTYRIQNSVKYVSPTWRGFTGEALYGFSNGAGAFATNRVYSVAGSYHAGGFAAALAYMNTTGGGVNTTGAVASDNQTFTAGAQENFDAGVSYTFANRAMLAFAYSRVNVYDPVSNVFFTTQPAAGSQIAWKFDNFDINGQWFFRPDLSLAADYTYSLEHITTTSGHSTPKWQQVALMLNYALSKRTSLYVQGAYQHVNGDTNSQFDNASIVGSAAISSSGNQMVYRVAMLHRF